MSCIFSRIASFVLILAFSQLVISCGGGSGGGVIGATSETDVVQAKQLADERYHGDKQQAVFDFQQVSHWVRQVVRGTEGPLFIESLQDGGSSSFRSAKRTVLGLTFSPQSRQKIGRPVGEANNKISRHRGSDKVEVNEGLACDHGSARVQGVIQLSNIDTEASRGFLTYTFTRCTLGEGVFNGKIKLVNVEVFHDGGLGKGKYVFDAFRLKGGGVDVEYTGVVEKKEHVVPESAGYQAYYIGYDQYLLISDLATGRQVKYENFRLVDYSGYLWLAEDTQFMVGKPEGKIYSDDLGYIKVGGGSEYGFLKSRIASSDYPAPSEGSVDIMFSAGERIAIDALQHQRVRLVMHLSDQSSGALMFMAKWSDFWGESGSDFSDSDGDGMFNSWEVYHGLNPENGSDKLTDLDGDGFSNFDEYFSGTDISDRTSIPPVTDLVATSFPVGKEGDGLVVTGQIVNVLFNLDVQNGAGFVPAEKIEFELKVPEDASIQSISIGKYEPEREIAFSCRIVDGFKYCRPDPNALGEFHKIDVLLEVPGTPGIYEAQITLTSLTLDADPVNNVAITNLDVIWPYADMAISDYTRYTVAPQYEEFRVEYFISRISGLVVGNIEVTVSLELPDSVTYSRVESNPNFDSWSCTDGAVLECSFVLAEDTSVEILDLWLYGPGVGISEPVPIRATVSSSVRDPDESNNIDMSGLLAGKSSFEIQQLIDAAPDGAEVFVPSGVYLGSIDINDKSIKLIGEEGADRTILIFDEIESSDPFGSYWDLNPEAIPERTIKGFTFLSTQARTDLALVNIREFSENIVDGLGVSRMRLHFFSSLPDPILITRNVFRNSMPKYGDDNLVNISSAAVVTNNLFYADPLLTAASLMSVGLSQEAGTSLNLSGPIVISNNVFSGGWSGTRVHSPVVLTNNIYYGIGQGNQGNGYAIEVSETVLQDSKTVWNKNILFNNAGNYFSSTGSGGGAVTQSLPGTEGDLFIDPLFVDVGASNFRLAPGSPAVDAGVPSGAPAVDIENTPRPLDGDSDGTAVVDIGAYEVPAM